MQLEVILFYKGYEYFFQKNISILTESASVHTMHGGGVEFVYLHYTERVLCGDYVVLFLKLSLKLYTN